MHHVYAVLYYYFLRTTARGLSYFLERLFLHWILLSRLYVPRSHDLERRFVLLVALAHCSGKEGNAMPPSRTQGQDDFLRNCKVYDYKAYPKISMLIEDANDNTHQLSMSG